MKLVYLLLLIATQVYSQSTIKLGEPSQDRKEICQRTTITSTTQESRKLKQTYDSLSKIVFGQETNPLASYFKTQQIDYLAFNNNAYRTYVVLAFLPILFFLFILPFVCCCCCCPQCCPSKCCKCCRTDVEYSKCQKIWPGVVLIILMLTVFATSIPGLIKGPKVVQTYHYMGCRSYAFLDDIYVGRKSDDDSVFWTGLDNILQSVDDIKKEADKIQTQLDTAFDNTDNVKTAGTNLATDVDNVYDNYNNISYSGLFNNADQSPIASVPSIFKEKFLGPTDDSEKSNIQLLVTYVMKKPIETANKGLFDILDKMKQAGDNIDQIQDFNATLDQGVSAIEGFRDPINSTKGFMATFFDQPTYANYLKIGILVYFIIALALSLIILIGTLAILCFGLFKLRYLNYAACSLMLLISIIGVVVVLVLGVLNPTMYYACQSITPAISDSKSFQQLLQGISPSVGEKVSVCISGGDGNILLKINPDFGKNIDDLQKVSQNLLDFDKVTAQAGFNLTQLYRTTNASTQLVNEVKKNKAYDIDNTDALGHIKRVTDLTYTSSSCNGNQNDDSWVPNQQNPLAECRSGVAKKDLCSDISSTTTCPSGCYDITLQLNGCQATQNCDKNPTSNFKTELQTRYNTGCNYAQYVSLLYQWDQQRKTSLNLVTQNIRVNVSGGINQLDTQVNKLKDDFKGLKESFERLLAITDPQVGVLSGINCLPIGQNLVSLTQSMCIQFYTHIFFTYLCLIIIIWAWIFGFCCVTCVGVRAHKQQQFNKQNPDGKQK